MKLLKNNYSACALAAFCTLLWGTAFPLIKLGYIHFAIEQGNAGGKLLFAGIRFMLAGVMVFVIGLIIRKNPPIIMKKDFLPVAALGTVQTFGQYIFAYIGVGLTTATNTSVLTGTASVFSILIAAMCFRDDRLTALKNAGCVVGLAGAALVNIADFSLNPSYIPGDILVLCSALCGAGGNVITRKIMPGRDPAAVTAAQLFLGGLVLTVTGLLLGGRLDLLNTGGTVILLWLALVSAVSFLLWTALLRYHPVSMISVFTMLVPIFGTLFSLVFLGEGIFGAQNLISLALVSGGIILVNINIYKKGKQNEDQGRYF